MRRLKSPFYPVSALKIAILRILRIFQALTAEPYPAEKLSRQCPVLPGVPRGGSRSSVAKMDTFVLQQDTPKLIRKFFPQLWHAGACIAYALPVIINPFRKSVWQTRQKSLGRRASSVSVQIAASLAVWMLAYFFFFSGNRVSIGARLTDENPVAMPEVGSYGLRVLSPTLLELTLITTKNPDPATVTTWNFVGSNFTPNLPAASQFTVTANAQSIAVTTVGFKRRPIYAPLKARDLRLGNHLYLKLASPIPDGAAVEVKNPSNTLWNAPVDFTSTADPLRFNPAIHVNQVGYMPNHPKKAAIGYYLGSMGELPIATGNGFKIINATNGAIVFSGPLTQRNDTGFVYTPKPYQAVYEADFSAFTTPGEYRLQIPGMGASYSFLINEGTSAAFARTFALGVYHQRCGAELGLPHTRHDHGYCHTNLVEIPTMDSDFAAVNAMLADKTSDAKTFPRHTAPALSSVNASLYPFVRQGKIDVSKGHHDAGDYSKYTINSAGMLHFLTFAADSFAGVGDLDNLGLPESGDGKSDLLQEAKWEADYLAKMQDSDGGFYFLVYPKTREYEQEVTPDHGDPQVVWPKTTAVTAAATAALAEIASSPKFKQQFPTEAALYLQKAQLGWNFLISAIARYGKDGSYQKITHYGNEFMHDDELVWAASAMFAATGEATYLDKLKEWMPNPNSTSIRRWGWWRMFEGYGCAIRTYAFAARSGRLSTNVMDLNYLALCENEIKATGDDIARFSTMSAYGTSFSDLYKAQRSAGWYFSSERAFDITVAYQLDPRANYREAVTANINFEAGNNPLNMTYITGMGWKRQRDIVHQHAQNDRQILPPSGIPQGNVIDGSPYLGPYLGELTALTFPSDHAATAPYSFYDRFVDAFHTKNEFVIMDEARSAASLAFWMAQSSIATQPWKSATGQITGLPANLAVDEYATLNLSVPGVDLTGAQVIWEIKNMEPAIGLPYRFTPKYSGDTWVEAEAMLSDGRRIFVKTNFVATTGASVPPNAYQSVPVTADVTTAAIYHLDGNLIEATGKQPALALSGNTKLDTSNLGWMANRAGGALRFNDLGDQATASFAPATVLKAGTEYVSVEAMIQVNALRANNRGLAHILSLSQNYYALLELREDMYQGLRVLGGSMFSFSGSSLNSALTLNQWHHFSMRIDKTGYTVKLDGNVIASMASAELSAWNVNGAPLVLQLGDFDGWIDEVVVRSGTGTLPQNVPPTVSLLASPLTAVAPANISLLATASDTDGSISKVEFFNGANKLGEVSSSPYSYTWFSVPAGVYSLTARATDNGGQTATSTALTLTVTAPTIVTNTPVTAAGTFVRTDTTTKGNWRGVYGANGYTVIGDSQVVPPYGGATPSGHTEYIWTTTTSETRALQNNTGTDRVVAAWYAANSFNLDFNFTDTNTHRVSLYFMDWDNAGRSERVEVIDPSNNAILATTDVSNFAQGKYLTWDLRGKVRLRVNRIVGDNALIEGLFFDTAPNGSGNGNGSLKLKGKNAQGARLEISGTTGYTYTIQSTDNMTTWTNVEAITLTAPTVEYFDTNASPGLRFYRLAK